MLRVTAQWHPAGEQQIGDRIEVEFRDNVECANDLADALRSAANFFNIRVEKLTPTWEVIG